jgi:uncharacterized membrane protein YsdA (DUF1294 family)
MRVDYLLIVLLVLALLYSYWFGYTPALIGLIYFSASLVSFALYAKDKKAAKKGAWRVQENTLHLSALVGGWPGAILGQQLLRHKTQKTSFRLVFAISLLLNISLLAWLHSPNATQKLRYYIYKTESWVVNQFGINKGTTIILELSKFHRLR